MRENDGTQFDRLPRSENDRMVEGRPSREAVIAFFVDRFGIPSGTFESHTFWEKGAGRVWAFAAEIPAPRRVEALGLPILRTRQEYWKPTTVGALRFCREATRNVIELDRSAAARFVAGNDQELDWEGDWGYLIASHVIAGTLEPIGVGLYVHGELQSMIPKGRRRTLPETRPGTDGGGQ